MAVVGSEIPRRYKGGPRIPRHFRRRGELRHSFITDVLDPCIDCWRASFVRQGVPQRLGDVRMYYFDGGYVDVCEFHFRTRFTQNSIQSTGLYYSIVLVPWELIEPYFPGEPKYEGPWAFHAPPPPEPEPPREWRICEPPPPPPPSKERPPWAPLESPL